MSKNGFSIKNLQWLMCHETKPNQTKQPLQVRVDLEVMVMKVVIHTLQIWIGVSSSDAV